MRSPKVLVLIGIATVGIFSVLYIYINNKSGKTEVTGEDAGLTEALNKTPLSSKNESEIPSDFPTDFPIFHESTLISSWSSGGSGHRGFSLAWETETKKEDVYNFYKEELEKNSWEIENQVNSKDSGTISFEKGEIFGFVGITQGSSGKTVISVTIGKKDI